MAKWFQKPISEEDVQYWWRVLEGKKLVKLKDYKFDAKVAMFTEETLPQPIRVLNDNEVVPEGREAQRYTLWVDENRVCVGLEAG